MPESGLTVVSLGPDPLVEAAAGLLQRRVDEAPNEDGSIALQLRVRVAGEQEHISHLLQLLCYHGNIQWLIITIRHDQKKFYQEF